MKLLLLKENNPFTIPELFIFHVPFERRIGTSLKKPPYFNKHIKNLFLGFVFVH
jgi:hypothetical protein